MVRNAFASDPLPSEFFRNDIDLFPDDIPNDVKACFLGKRWTEITIQDWRGHAVSVHNAMHYLTPCVFRYYLPSLLVSSIQSQGDFQYAVEALLPANQKHVPRGQWWSDYFDGFNQQQREVVREFLKYILLTEPEENTDYFNARLALETIWR